MNRDRTLGFLLWTVVTTSGCSDPSAPVHVESVRVAAPPVLTSELEALPAGPVRLDPPLRFRNRTRQPQTISLIGKGCSCYGLTTSDRPLATGESFEIAPDASADVYFTSRLRGVRATQSLRATFRIPGGDGESVDLVGAATMDVYPDVELEPSVLSYDLRPGEAGSPETVHPTRQTLTVRRVIRAEASPQQPPSLLEPPAFLTGDGWSEAAAPEQVAEGLWRETWSVELTAHSTGGEFPEDGARFVFHVEFPEFKGPPPAPVPAEGTTAPSVPPRLSSVLRANPQLAIEGRIVVARRRGIASPRKVHLGAVPVGSTRTRRVLLNALDRRPFRVSMENLPEGIAVRSEDDEPRAQQWLNVDFTPTSAGDWSAEVALRTDHPDQPVVRIRFEARVDSGG